MALKKEIATLEELIATAGIEQEKLYESKAKLVGKILRYKMITEKKR